ncbi:AlpA family phage regulatory protein [Mannheimia sp. AT1]|uniref:AlpA family phage regulatory protein n=1 Tax=Mannheimia cairinae TaxID=3025936 RepID=A0ABT5MR16_9PAST|nr:AlpA family phage regulatory protein [Mannheimia cairinae]MDD0824610.1 AlpA family phage regulatory protein [Mannheimia cairinae]MDD0826461.1 AlpA family phage regulatory protein [Mannheimia cairinae]
MGKGIDTTEKNPTSVTKGDKILRTSEVKKMLGIGKTTFSDWQNPKSKRYRPDFPKKIQLGANSVGYLESEINAFIQSLADSRTK